MSHTIKSVQDKLKDYVVLCVCGGRRFNNHRYAQDQLILCIKSICRREKVTVDQICIIEGGAEGADRIAKEFAEKFNFRRETFKAYWRGPDGKGPYNPGAGHLRNSSMVAISQYHVSFWDGNSKGTADCIKKSCKERSTL